MNALTSQVVVPLRGGRWIAAAAVLTCCGCNLWHAEQRISAPLPIDSATRPRSDGEHSLPVLEKLLACTNDVRRADGTTVKEPTEGWFLPLSQPGASRESASKEKFRWRHAGLDRWLAIPAKERTDLALALGSSNRAVAAAATIGLARTGKKELAGRLASIATDGTFAVPTRRAAIEALAHLDDDASRAQFDELFARLTPHETVAQTSSYDPLLHAELLRGLALRRGVQRDAKLAGALKESSSEVRLAALEMIADHAERPLPEAALALLDDPEPRVRIAALNAAASHRAKGALPAALKSARHPEPDMRLAAIAALSAIGGEEALAELRQQTRREAELFQEAAVAGLARLKDMPAVYEAAGDKSFRVRRAVAAALADEMRPEAVPIARKLLSDPSPQVQERTIESISSWPLSTAGPLLMAGLESRSYKTRTAALAALANRWPAAAALSPSDLQPLVLDRSKVDRLRAAWSKEFGPLEEISASDVVAASQGARANPLRPNAQERSAAADSEALRERLGGSDKHARIEAALALGRLGEKSGVNVLESLTFDPDPQIRRCAAAAIGELADPQLVGSLVRLLDDEPSVRLAALKALPLAAGADIAHQADSPTQSSAEQAQRWKDWYRH